MSKTSKHFYLEDNTLITLKLLKKKLNVSSSEIVNNAINYYYNNLDKEEDAMTYVVKSIKELSDNITSSQNLSKKNTDELKEYIKQLQEESMKDGCESKSNSKQSLELSSIENDLLNYIESHPNLAEVGKSYTIPAIRSGEKMDTPTHHQIECNIVIKSTSVKGE